MKKILVFALSLSMTVVQLLPFCIMPLVLIIAYAKIEKFTGNSYYPNDEPEHNVILEIVDLDTVFTDTTLDIKDYGKIGYNKDYFTVVKEESTDIKKTLLYKDNKSKITISYIAGMSDTINAHDYMIQEVAGFKDVEYDSYTWDIFRDYWEVVSTKSEETNTYFIYRLSDKQTHAMWLHIEVDASVDESEDLDFMNNIIFRMLESAEILYTGETIFETPSGGYYDENSKDEEEEPTEDKPTEEEPDYGLSKDWSSLQVMINNAKIELPMTLQELMNLGFYIDERSQFNSNDLLTPGAAITVKLNNGGNATISVKVRNNTEESMKLADGNIVKIVIDKSEFKYIADLRDDYLVLPQGVKLSSYTESIINKYGTPNKTENLTSTSKKLTWIKDGKQLTIYCGAVAFIDKIEIEWEN